MLEYSADPSLRDVPLQLSELEAYAADPAAFVKDARKVPHLLARVTATVQLYKSQIQSLNRDVQDMQLRRDRVGAATTMSPRDAVKFLSPQELSLIVGGTAKHMLDHAQRVQLAAEQARRDATTEWSRARFTLLGALEDPALPPELRARLEAALAAAPTADAQPGVPAVVEEPAPGDAETSDAAATDMAAAALDSLFGDDFDDMTTAAAGNDHGHGAS
jgi:hypothetical protein